MNFTKLIIILFFAFSSQYSFAINRDSLLSVWENKTNHDTVRTEAIHDLGWSYIYTNPDSALYYARIQLDHTKKKNNFKWQGYAMNTIGMAHLMKSEIDSALWYLELSCDLMEKIGERKKVAVSKSNLGSIYASQEKIFEALNYFYEAVAIFEEIHDTSLVAQTFVNIGLMHKKLGEYSVALDHYHTALKRGIEKRNLRIQAACLVNIANLYLELGNEDSTSFYINRAYIIHKNTGDMSGQVHSLNIISENFLSLGEIDSAKFYAHAGLPLLNQTKDIRGLSSIHNLLGRIHLLEHRNDSALYYFKLGLEEGIMSSSLEEQIKGYQGLSEVFELKGNYTEAFSNYKNYVLLKDSLNSEANLKALTQQEMRYNFNKQTAEDSLEHVQELIVLEKDKEKQTAISEETDRRNKIVIAGVSIVLILVGGIAFILFKSNKRRRADNLLITKQKQEVEEQKNIVEEKNAEITDSINYAKRIQTAILPPAKLITEFLPDNFILYLPKDIVAGDFYWFHQGGDSVHIAVADCTGHGVPGALVSVVCHNALNRSVREFNLEKPNLILDKTRELVIETFEKSEEEVKDGMDISLCSISLKSLSLQFSGANNSIYLIRKDELMELKADKQPIGKYEHATPFSAASEQLQKGDLVYLFSDGFADQFGGPKGKKLKYQSMKDFLLANKNKEMRIQQKMLHDLFETWRGPLEQVDDICIIGVKI